MYKKEINYLKKLLGNRKSSFGETPQEKCDRTLSTFNKKCNERFQSSIHNPAITITLLTIEKNKIVTETMPACFSSAQYLFELSSGNKRAYFAGSGENYKVHVSCVGNSMHVTYLQGGGKGERCTHIHFYGPVGGNNTLHLTSSETIKRGLQRLWYDVRMYNGGVCGARGGGNTTSAASRYIEAYLKIPEQSAVTQENLIREAQSQLNAGVPVQTRTGAAAAAAAAAAEAGGAVQGATGATGASGGAAAAPGRLRPREEVLNSWSDEEDTADEPPVKI